MAGYFLPRDLNTEGFQPWGHQMWPTVNWRAMLVAGGGGQGGGNFSSVIPVVIVILQMGLKNRKGKNKIFFLHRNYFFFNLSLGERYNSEVSPSSLQSFLERQEFLITSVNSH